MLEQEVSVLHARYEHGNHPVWIFEPRRAPSFEVKWPPNLGGPRQYKSARKLVRALANGGDAGPTSRDPGMSLERYFRVGRFGSPKDTAHPNIFDLFAPQMRERPIVLPEPARPVSRKKCPPEAGRWYKPAPEEPSTLTFFSSISVEGAGEPVPKPGGLCIAPVHAVGVDLEHRFLEVKKLVCKGFAGTIMRYGYDFDEIFQEVYRGLLARDRGKGKFDQTRSSFGHYIYMVTGCIIANYRRKMMRTVDREYLGLRGPDGEPIDASHFARATAEAPDESAGMALALESLSRSLSMAGTEPDGSLRDEARVALLALPFVKQGYVRGEIARILGIEPPRVAKALSFLRRVTWRWARKQGLR
jgi:hypothetical protein